MINSRSEAIYSFIKELPNETIAEGIASMIMPYNCKSICPIYAVCNGNCVVSIERYLNTVDVSYKEKNNDA